jgi:hypothetical protein
MKNEAPAGDIFIANAIANQTSPSGAAHITLGVAPLGSNALDLQHECHFINTV